MAENAGKNTVGATDTVLSILETLQDLDGARVSEIADELDVSKSTVHRHLKTLENREYVAREGDEYVIGLRFLDVGEYVKTRKKAYGMAESKVKEIAEETNERAQFIVEEHGMAVYVHREIGERAVHTDPGVGKRIPLHATAAGKAIMAHLEDARVDELLETRGLPALTDNTLTDEAELREELETIRERGYSFNRQENIKGLQAIGVPVMAPDGRVIGALSVSGPTKRMTGERYHTELPELLMGVANELELNIAYA